MRFQRGSEDRHNMIRVQRLVHHTDAAPMVPSGNPEKMQRAARRATKIACKGHRKYWVSGY
jgi:hypothetical protein